jgi:thiol-disulfide isomerase/thioredoxin
MAFVLSITVGISFGDTEEPVVKDFSLRDYKTMENESFSDTLQSKVNIMVVTETTCSSCIKELKSLEWLKDRYGSDLTVTTVFIDRVGWSRVRKYLDLYNFDLDFFLIDAGQVVPQRFGVSYIPSLIMFDKKGNEKYRKQGFAEGEESLISAKIDEVLSGKGSRRPVAAKPLATDTAGTTGLVPEVKKTSGCASTG